MSRTQLRGPGSIVAAVPATVGCSAPADSPPGPEQKAGDPRGLRVVYSVSGMDRVDVRRGLTYRQVDGEVLEFDAYSPPGLGVGERRPAVIFIHGGPIGVADQPQEWGQYRSYGEMVAASGFVAITFKHRLYRAGEYADSATDLAALLAYVRSHPADLRADPERLALWAISAGGPLLSLAFAEQPAESFRCLISFYSILDLGSVPDQFGGSAPRESRERFSTLARAAEAVGPFSPVLIARAGRDFGWLNDSVDEFVRMANRKGIPLDLVTHPKGRHAFDINDPDDRSREIIERTIGYLKEHLSRP